MATITNKECHHDEITIPAIIFFVLGLAFLTPSYNLLFFEPQLGFKTPGDFYRLDLIRAGWESVNWLLADLVEIICALALLSLAASIKDIASEGNRTLGRFATYAAIVAASLFLLVGLTGLVGVAAAKGQVNLTDSAWSAVIVIRAVFRAGSVFMLGVLLAAFVVLAVRERLLHPLVATLGALPTIGSLIFPWIMLPVPLIYVIWFLAVAINLFKNQNSAVVDL